MSLESEESSVFKAALARTPTDVIVKKLDENIIARSWKRDLAEEEVARRNKAESLRVTDEASQKYHRHKSAMLKGWGVTVLLIACAVIAAIATVFL
ncbi:hypothetical protein ACFL12_05555 [Pseudomonadota bacterium]